MEPLEGQMTESSGSDPISTKRQRIADLAARMPETPLTTLAHHIDHAWLKEAYRQTRKSGATGVDGQTAEAYAADLDAKLFGLNPEAYLTDILARINDHPNKRLDDLLPWNWQPLSA
jgi:hypothetical protein